MLIITGGLEDSHPKIRASQAFVQEIAVCTWHTVVMVEWCEVRILDGMRVRLVAANSGLRAVQFPPFGPVEGERNESNTIICEAAAELRS